VEFVTIYNTGGVPSLQLFRKVLERRAPKTLPEIERLVAPQPLGQGTVAKNIANELLDASAEAHREAVGRKPCQSSCACVSGPRILDYGAVSPK
jgi:hypothetical protein